jgi:hypothetical protein
MKTLFFILTILLSVALMGAKITDNTLKLGDQNAANDKTIDMSDGKIKWDAATSKLQFTNDDGSSYKDIGSGGGGGQGTNLLQTNEKNHDFELGTTAEWTASAGVFTAETTSPGFGTTSGKWDAGAASQNLDSSLVTVIPGLEGRQCVAQWQYKLATGSTGDLKAQVLNSTSVVLAEKDITVSTIWAEDFLIFSCPTTNSIRVRFTSTADAGEFLVDDVHLGSDILSVNVGSAEFVGSVLYNASANCQWDTTTAVADIIDNDCTNRVLHGEALAPSSNYLIGTKFASLPAGVYYVIAKFTAQAVTADSTCLYQIHDGTSGTKEGGATLIWANDTSGTSDRRHVTFSGTFEYNTEQTNVDFRVRGGRVNGSGTCRVEGELTWQSAISLSVYRFPTTAQSAVTYDTSALGWSGYHSTDCEWTTTSNSYVDPSDDGSCTFAQTKNLNFGSVATYGASKPGIVFTPKRTGTYFVCANVHAYNTTAANIADYRLTDGTNVIGEQGVRASSGIPRVHVSICGLLPINSISSTSLRIEMRDTGAGTTVIGGGGSPHAIDWTIFPISQQFPMPVINNSVTTPYSAGLKITTAFITNNAGVPSVGSQFGNWIDSVDDDGVGDYGINFVAGTFSQSPNCFLQVQSSSWAVARINEGPNLAGFDSVVFISNTAAAFDGDYMVMCIGPK